MNLLNSSSPHWNELHSDDQASLNNRGFSFSKMLLPGTSEWKEACLLEDFSGPEFHHGWFALDEDNRWALYGYGSFAEAEDSSLWENKRLSDKGTDSFYYPSGFLASDGTLYLLDEDSL